MLKVLRFYGKEEAKEHLNWVCGEYYDSGENEVDVENIKAGFKIVVDEKYIEDIIDWDGDIVLDSVDDYIEDVITGEKFYIKEYYQDTILNYSTDYINNDLFQIEYYVPEEKLVEDK